MAVHCTYETVFLPLSAWPNVRENKLANLTCDRSYSSGPQGPWDSVNAGYLFIRITYVHVV